MLFMQGVWQFATILVSAALFSSAASIVYFLYMEEPSQKRARSISSYDWKPPEMDPSESQAPRTQESDPTKEHSWTITPLSVELLATSISGAMTRAFTPPLEDDGLGPREITGEELDEMVEDALSMHQQAVEVAKRLHDFEQWCVDMDFSQSEGRQEVFTRYRSWLVANGYSHTRDNAQKWWDEEEFEREIVEAP